MGHGVWGVGRGAWGVEPGSWVLGPGSWVLGPGCWGLGPGAWGLFHGAWGLGSRKYSVSQTWELMLCVNSFFLNCGKCMLFGENIKLYQLDKGSIRHQSNASVTHRSFHFLQHSSEMESAR